VKKFVKRTYKIVTVSLLILSILIISGAIVGKIYNDEIRTYVISEINSQIEVKVNVSSAEFSVFRKFPYVSIVLNNAVALSSKDFEKSQFTEISPDTLFTASRIYLQFNLIDILNKNYRLRKVHAVNGKVNILVDSAGNGNYTIIKSSAQDQKENNFAIGLDGVRLSGFKIEFHNLVKGIKAKGAVSEVILKGKFSQNNFSLNSLSSIFIETFSREGIEYASEIKLGSRIILDVKDSVYTISRGEISLNDLNFKAGGSFTAGSKIMLDFQIAGEKLNIRSLINTLPVDIKDISFYAPTGQGEILAKIKGELSNTLVPSIRAAFKVTNGKIYIPSRESYVNGIDLRGTYSNGTKHSPTTSRLNLSDYSISYGNNVLKGRLSLDNFINPFVSASLLGSIQASDLSEILNYEGLKLESGFIYPDLSFNLSLDSIGQFDIMNISARGLNGKIDFKEISGITPVSKLPIENLEGQIRMEGETWFPEFRIKIGKNSLYANLIVLHFWEYMINKSRIPEINGEINAEYISVTDFLSDESPDENYEFHMPDSIYLNLHCTADSFIYGRFHSAAAESWFTYKPGLLSISSLNIQTMKGRISASGAVIADNEGQMLVRASGNLRNIDINMLFYAFHNFGQDFIISDNLKGSGTGNIDYSGYISPKFDLLTKNLTAQSDFIIEEGELINFEPITELSSFVELSELQHIKFSTLKNSILIKDEKVYIPQMDINSSAFNITISGTHGFDNYFEYKLRLSLSEILAGKARNAKKENEEFGTIEDDGSGNTNIYLSLIGTPDDFKIKYDKKEAISKIKANLKEEKKLLKTILNEELGLFKKDSASILKNSGNQDKKPFIMDWSEEKDNPLPKEVKNKKDPAFKISWDEEDPE